MIGFSIMMWFVSLVILMVAISLLRGNVSTMHGKVFDTTEDKGGYGKQLGKMSLFISIGLCICGVVAFLIKSSMAIVYALVIRSVDAPIFLRYTPSKRSVVLWVEKFMTSLMTWQRY